MNYLHAPYQVDETVGVAGIVETTTQVAVTKREADLLDVA